MSRSPIRVVSLPISRRFRKSRERPACRWPGPGSCPACGQAPAGERPVGSGLGLAIVRELVAAMGGSVEAAAPAGGGAQFTIRLSLAPARPAPPDAVRPYA
ncbi:ATP-binding protein [Lacticaseibacillus rhamnosus]